VITVEELKKRRENETEVFIEKISSKVEARNDKGYNSEQVDIPNNIVVSSVIDVLQSHGFKVRRVTGHDSTFSDSWDYLDITWNI
jgi:hypothetical protein